MRYFLLIATLSFCSMAFSQRHASLFKAGYQNLITVDTGRLYKQPTKIGDRLHFRPVEIDLWYPSIAIADRPVQYGYFLNLLQQRSNRYQDDTLYKEMTAGLVTYLSAGLDIRDTAVLMHLPTASYQNAVMNRKRFPLIIYLCSFNGMSYENISLFETLAAEGYMIACITSVGRYPGNMQTKSPDLMEQVADADFAIRYLYHAGLADTTAVGVIGYSWGGLAALQLAKQNARVKCLLSLDGSEMHYYGESKEEDSDFNKIVRLLIPFGNKLAIPYAYLESGFKQADQPADSIFPITMLAATPIYARFSKAAHEDFSFLSPRRFQDQQMHLAAQDSGIPYQQIVKYFFDEYLLGLQSSLATLLDSLYRNDTADSLFPLARKLHLMRFSGKIVDEQNGEPLAFVNVGIWNKNTGTVSASDGRFQINIDSALTNDSLTFSMVGYQARSISIRDLDRKQKPILVPLRVKTATLKEVNIVSKLRKTKILGNTTTSRFVSIGLPLKYLGSETGIRLRTGNTPLLLKSFSFNISDNRLDTALFRLNIYRMKNGSPGENILHQNILIPVGKQTGKFNFNLKPYQLIIEGDVLLSLEWIAGSANEGNGVLFLSAGFLNSATWHRLTSQAEWKKASGLGVGFNVSVEKLQD